MSAPCTAESYLLNRLKELDIRHMLEAPGDSSFPFLNRIEADRDVAWVGNCNELNASYAADAYARCHGIAAMAATFGWEIWVPHVQLQAPTPNWFQLLASFYTFRQEMAQHKFKEINWQ